MPRALINVHSFLQDLNPSKFTVYFSTLIFAILFSLKLDNRITLSYWLVFLPLWIWKGIAFLGAIVGIIVWLRNPDYRVGHSSYVHFKSMLISLSLQLLLLMFEILVCDKLESKRHTWMLAFVPLLFISLLSISVCVWSVRNGREIELEFFAAINILQIILVALKLDALINWSWMVIFIPSWILLCFAIVVIFYAMIFAALVLRSPDFGSEQRRANINSTSSSSSLIFLPLLVFIILLMSKLDSPPNVITPSYFLTCAPLFLTLLILLRQSFGSKTGSLWWFGMRTDFCTFLLTIFPCLKEYGNTSFVMNPKLGDNSVSNATANSGDQILINPPEATVSSGPATVAAASNPLGSAVYYLDHNNATTTTTGNPHLAGRRDVNSNGERQQGGGKWLFSTLSRKLFREKFQRERDERDALNSPVAPKLTIDAPD